MADVASIEVIVNLDKVCNEALFEFAQNFHKKTGVQLLHVDFDWMDNQMVGHPSEPILNSVTVTSSGRAA